MVDFVCDTTRYNIILFVFYFVAFNIRKILQIAILWITKNRICSQVHSRKFSCVPVRVCGMRNIFEISIIFTAAVYIKNFGFDVHITYLFQLRIRGVQHRETNIEGSSHAHTVNSRGKTPVWYFK